MASIFREALKRVAYAGLGESFLHQLHGQLPRILTYHRFPESAVRSFDRQCKHLRRHYNPVSIDQIVTALRDGTALPPRSIAITIDDGYRDVFENAAPVLKRYQLAATLYAVSGFLDGDCWMWWDRIEYAFAKTTRSLVELDLPGRGALQLKLGTELERRASARGLCAFLVRTDNSEAESWCKDIAERLDVSLPDRAAAPYQPVSWDQARELIGQQFTIGSHTVHHWVVGTLKDAQTRRSEIAASRERIQAMIDQPVDHFCFPNGGIGDFSRADLEQIRQAGYASSATLLLGLVQPNSDRFQLPRINVDAGLDLGFFRMKVAGLFRHSPVNLPGYGPASSGS